MHESITGMIIDHDVALHCTVVLLDGGGWSGDLLTSIEPLLIYRERFVLFCFALLLLVCFFNLLM
jgi:hypothetical protein